MRQTSRHTDEINDANWGTTKIIFKGGTATETTNHAKGEFTDDFAYKIDGDTVTFQRHNGERFVMRWVIKGDQADIHPGRLPRCRPYPLRDQAVHASTVSL